MRVCILGTPYCPALFCRGSNKVKALHEEHVEEYNLWLDGEHDCLYPNGYQPDIYQMDNMPYGDCGGDRDVVRLEDY